MKPREIELTSKKLKAHIICCYLLFMFGTGIFLIADESQMREASITTLLFWLVGGVWYIITKFRVWWNHS